MIGGFRNRLIVGVNIHNGTIDISEYVNLPGAMKGPLVTIALWKSQNDSAYAENSFYSCPNVASIAGGQFLHAVRDQQDRFLVERRPVRAAALGTSSVPKVGVLWDVDPAWQVFGNISRSAEVPTFDVNTFAAPASSNVDAQTATTYEIGTRGRRPDVTWDLSLYRAEIRNELQCLTTSPFSLCSSSTPTAPSIRAWRPGSASRSSSRSSRRRTASGSTSPIPTTTSASIATRVCGNNRLPGVPPHYLRAEVLYKHPNGFYAGPNVEWMPQALLRRQRQYADGRPVCAA